MENYEYNAELNIASKLADKIPHYEHAKILNYDAPELKNMTYTHNEIKEKGVLGNVISTYRDKNGELKYVIADLAHQHTVGVTGVGKSTGPVFAQLEALALSGRASGVIVDSKGEQFESTAASLRELGYNVCLFNLKDSSHSELWNCFYSIAEKFSVEYKSIGSNVSKIIEKGRNKYVYKNKVFYSKKDLAKFYEKEIDTLFSSTISEIRGKIVILLPVQNHRDSSWEMNSWKMLTAAMARLVLCLVDVDKKRRTTLDQINLYNVQKIFNTFEVGRFGKIKDQGFFSGLNYTSKIYSEIKKPFFENADVTTRNLLQFVDDSLTRLNNKSFMNLTLTTTFKPEDLIDKKTILFITYDEADQLSRSFLSFFISSLISDLKNIADHSEKLRLKRPVLFIIDEFASLPRTDEIVDCVSYLRSRQIYIHYILQDYSQIKYKYGEKAPELKNNTTMIYLRTNDFETIQQISCSLGRCTVLSPGAVIGENHNYYYEEKPLVTCYELASLQQGEAIVSVNIGFNIKGHFEKSYECKEYECPRTSLSSYENKFGEMYDKCVFDIDNLGEFDMGDDEEDEDD